MDYGAGGGVDECFYGVGFRGYGEEVSGSVDVDAVEEGAGTAGVEGFVVRSKGGGRGMDHYCRADGGKYGSKRFERGDVSVVVGYVGETIIRCAQV